MKNENPTLHCKRGNSLWSFELLEKYLVHRWDQVRGPNKGEEHIALATLSPHLTVRTGRARGAWPRLIWGILLVAIGLISIMNFLKGGEPWQVAVFILSLVGYYWIIYHGLRVFEVQTWTVVRSQDGRDIAHWTSSSCRSDAEREAFEAAFHAAFHAAVENEAS